MLGLASMTSAILAGVVAASKEATFCSTLSSHRRKSSCVSPRKRVPSGAVTVHCTSTKATLERIIGASPGFAEVPSPAGIVRISPVDGSREIRTSFSRTRGRGSFAFCAAADGPIPATSAQTVAIQRVLILGWYFAGNFIMEMMPGYLQSAVLLKIKIADWLFCRTLACPFEFFFDIARQS